MNRRRLTTLVPVALVVLAVISCGGGDDPAPAPPSNPNGTIAGNGGSGFVNSSGGASGKNSSGTTGGSATVTEESFDFEGTERKYVIATPNTIVENKKYPLVLAFHPNQGTPGSMQTLLPYETVSQGGAFVVYPPAADGSDWSADDTRDTDFVKALIEELASKKPIDKTAVLGFGYSGGAYFLSQFACRTGGVFKMVAMMATGAPEYQDGDQKRENGCVICPAGPVPMYIAHGMKDEELPFDGGDYARICWAEQNGCSNSSLSNLDLPCRGYKGCQAGKGVTWCAVPDQDHAPWRPSIEGSWKMFLGL